MSLKPIIELGWNQESDSSDNMVATTIRPLYPGINPTCGGGGGVNVTCLIIIGATGDTTNNV